MNKEEIYHFLSKLPYTVLSTVSPNGTPAAAVMFFLVDKNFNFFLLTQPHTQKYKNILEHPDVALTFVDPFHAKTVQATGIAKEVKRTDPKHLEIISKMAEKNAKLDKSFWPPPPSKIADIKVEVFEVVPTWLRFADFTQTVDVFHEITP